MAGSTFADAVKFTATAGSTANFTVAAAVTGFQTPGTAGAVGGNQYSYRAESTDLTQWEVGQGTYTSGSSVVSRTPLFNSAAGSSAINFTLAPTVGFVVLNEDLLTANITKAVQQTATSNVAGVTPLHQQDHPSAAKAWVNFTGATAAINASYNISSVVRNSAGNYTISFTTAFATANYIVLLTPQGTGSLAGALAQISSAALTTGSVAIVTFNPSTGTSGDATSVHAVCYGAQ